MTFAILTLLSALSLASVVGWFSIIGFMTIYAGAPMFALGMGVVLETSKLVTISWVYRNWGHAGWRLKTPLMYFIIVLMIVTSIGVYGFLAKAHIDQGANVVDNSGKVERIEQQIARENTNIKDNETVITQLDETIDGYIKEGYVTKSIKVRKEQQRDRDELRDSISASQDKIDELNSQKFELESEVRNLELEVGPIRYIAELIYGSDGDARTIIDSAVRIFTLLIVSTLDPLAVVLLIAANHSFMRLRKNKKQTSEPTTGIVSPPTPPTLPPEEPTTPEDPTPPEPQVKRRTPRPKKSKKPAMKEKVVPKKQEDDSLDTFSFEAFNGLRPGLETDVPIFWSLSSPAPSKILDTSDNKPIEPETTSEPWAYQQTILEEMLGKDSKHFIPKKMIDDELPENVVHLDQKTKSKGSDDE